MLNNLKFVLVLGVIFTFTVIHGLVMWPIRSIKSKVRNIRSKKA